MKKLNAFALTTGLMVVVIGLGVLSSKFIKPILVNLGFNQNWAWPLLCLVCAIVFCRLTGTSLFISRGSTKSMVVRVISGLIAGIALQGLFYLLNQRRPFEYQGFVLMPLLFQIVVSFSEELLFRGAFQAYLARSFGLGFTSQLIAAFLISVPFGVIHGLNPVLFNSGNFDLGWFLGTFSLSMLAGLAYALTRKVDAAFGVHIGHNLISTFF